MTCPRCNGSGECVECKGAGSITCASCDGSGKRQRSTGQTYPCARCKGTGRESCSPRCDSCQGSGTITDVQQKEIHDKYTMVGKPVEAATGFRMTSLLLILCVGQFLAEQAVPALGERMAFNGVHAFQLNEWWRLVSAQFMHVGWMHLGMNMLFLYSYGPVLEDALGPWRFLGAYLLMGAAGFALTGLLEPGQWAAGASGSLMGIGGLIWGLQTRYHPWSWDAVRSLVYWVVAWVAFGFLMPLGFANWAHLGGLASGFALAYVMKNPAAR